MGDEGRGGGQQTWVPGPRQMTSIWLLLHICGFFCDIPPIGFLTITSTVQMKFGPLTRLGPGPPTNFM